MAVLSVIEKERAWRVARGRPPGFAALAAHKPLVALGADAPLADQTIMADFFHGVDGLSGIHESHPHLSPSDAWHRLFGLAPPQVDGQADDNVPPRPVDALDCFEPSTVPAHRLMLRVLADNPPDTVTIVALGPMTNLALAAHEDTETFLRAKQVVVMGGAVDLPGNITPLAEFNTHADTIAFARVLALTSPHPNSTMPPWPPTSTPDTHLPPYPTPLTQRLSVVLAPLDITTPHVLSKRAFDVKLGALGGEDASSPLAEWLGAFLTPMWAKTRRSGGLSMHDPLAVMYAFDSARDPQRWRVKRDEDVRVETAGQWTRGACIVDRRGWTVSEGSGDVDEEKASDRGGWLDSRKGNRVGRVVGSPFWSGEQKDLVDEKFGELLLDMVFGQ